MKTLTNKVVSSLALLCLAGWLTNGGLCEADTLPSNTSPVASAEATADDGIRSITLPHFELQMPAAPGREAFIVVCVSCHSPRYVTMQPPFSRHQWEGIVDKMIKVYGAPAGTNQIRQTVDYLVAINGIAPKEPAKGSLPESETSSPSASTNLQQQVETTPLFAIAASPEEQAADVKRGATVFIQDCAGCHGADGRGDGIASQVLLPKPANLTVAQFSVELLSQMIWNGVPGTAMPSWRDLPKNDLDGLAAYVQTLHSSVNQNITTTETSTRGKTLFIQACAPCHGALGDGKSVAAATLAPAPTNLKWEQPDFDYVLQVLREGVPGTAMPVWKNQLSESDRAALANYVRTLYAPNQLEQK
jgi:cbb3-type cytochrome c oxidase subunit III